jgi:hypothetical protein
MQPYINQIHNKLIKVYDDSNLEQVYKEKSIEQSKIRQINKDVVDIQELHNELASYVLSQQEQLNTIEDSIHATQYQIKEGAKELSGASKIKSKQKIILGVSVFGVTGSTMGLIGGPVGALIGGSIGVIIGTAIGTSAANIENKRIERDARKAKL